MGFNMLFREVLRRIFGVKYYYHNVPVNSTVTFRFLRNLVAKGYHVYGFGNEFVVHTPFGDFVTDFADMDLLYGLFEPLEEIYGDVDVKDAIVIDIGAYIGDTSLLFLSKGASRVYALEPVDRHYHYLLKNISKNSCEGKIIPLNYGAWFYEANLDINYEGPATGLHMTAKTSSTIKLKYLGDILKEIHRREGRIDLVKMDCEGCEYSLINLPDDDIRLAKQYIIEIHGSETPIIDKMMKSGYKTKFVKNLTNMVTIYNFTYEHSNEINSHNT